MKRLLAVLLGAVVSVVSLHAGSVDLALVAAMKLPDAANYSWLSTVDDDGRSYTIEGQTDRATDYSLVTMPVVASIRRRAGTGTSNSGNVSAVIFKGDEKFVVQVDEAWKSPDELAADPRGSRGNYPGGWGGLRGRGRRGIGRPAGASQPPAYSNLQKTLSRPHNEVAIIVATATDLKAEGDIVSGTLSETAAKLLLVHTGQNEITPSRPAAHFVFGCTRAR